MSYQKYKETIKATNEARRAAIRLLIDNHREEFDNLYIMEAKARALNPTKIVAQVKRAEIAKVEEEKFENAVSSRVEQILSEVM